MGLKQIEKVKSLAIVGAKGLVGREFIAILEENKVKIPQVKLFGSSRSAGDFLFCAGHEIEIEELKENSLDEIEVAFFSVPTDISRKFIPKAIAKGTIVIDDSSAFRMITDVPLVVPEINASILKNYKGKLIANPNCSTIPVAQVLKPLQDNFGVKRVVVTTFQSVSGAGTKAYEELSKQTIAVLGGSDADAEVFPHPIAFNCLPQIGSILENGSSDEEEKIENELKKILNLSTLKVSATAVRVPTFCGHGASVNVTLESDPGAISSVRELLDATSGLKVIDQPSQHIYPTNRECIGGNETLVGRIRKDRSQEFGLNFWVMSDNLRKGAALNSLQILDSYLANLNS